MNKENNKKQGGLFFKSWLVLFYFTFGGIATIHAQDPRDIDLSSDYYSSVVPLSPEAASLGRYAALPINKFSGVPEITIPIWELKSRQLNLPVSLTYHSGGTKVEDIASWVGMGWSLQAGGAIIREVNGLPDELPTYGFFDTEDQIENFDNLSENEKKMWIERSEELTYDTEPDVFYFNFAGRTGKIIFDHQGKPRAIPRQSLKISYKEQDHKIFEFEIITAEGNKYVFGRDVNAVEETKYTTLEMGIKYDHEEEFMQCIHDGPGDYVYTGSTDPHINYSTVKLKDNKLTRNYFTSTWYLSRIESPFVDYIDFTYESNGTISYVSAPRISQSEMNITTKQPEGLGCIYADGLFISDFSIFNQNPDSPPPTEQSEWCAGGYCQKETDVFSVSKKASGPSIWATQSKIFVKSKRLAKINTASGTKMEFFASNMERKDLPGSRMLDRISIYNKNIIKSFNLKYQVITSNGYYSGKDFFSINEALAFKNRQLPGASPLQARDASSSTQLENQYLEDYIGEGLKKYNYQRTFLTAITESVGSTALPPFTFEYFSPEKLPRRTSLMQSGWGYTIKGYKQHPNVPSANGYMEVINAVDPSLAGYPEYGILKRITYPTGGYRVFNFVSNYKNAGISISDISDYNDDNKRISETAYTYIGNYAADNPLFKAYLDVQIGERIMKFHIATSYSLRKVGLVRGHFVGNFRVKVEKINFDNTGSPFSVGYEMFRYANPPNPGNLVYAIPKEKYYPDPDSDEYEERSKFTNIFPFPPNTSYDHQRGLLKEHLIYKQDVGAEPFLLKHVVNEYKFVPTGENSDIIYGLKGAKLYAGNTIKYRGGYYKHIVEWTKLESTTTDIYDADDPENEKKITSIINYEYDPIHMQIESTTTTNAEGNILTTTYKYPTDYVPDCEAEYLSCQINCFCVGSDPSCVQCLQECVDKRDECEAYMSNEEAKHAIIKMNDRHIIRPVIEKRVTVKEGNTEKVLSAELTDYKLYGNLIVLDKSLSFRSNQGVMDFIDSKLSNGKLKYDQRYIIERIFNDYDMYGNLLKQTTRDGIVTTYEWGYNNSLLTATNINPNTPFTKRTEYVHDPLVGLKSVKDYNGFITTYEYDQLNRLQSIKDHNGNIIKAYKYRYATEKLIPSFTNGLVIAGKSIKFSTSTNDLLYGITTSAWDFGDGSPLYKSTSKIAYHTYESSGDYNVTLTVKNPEYGEESISKPVRVYAVGTNSIEFGGEGSANIALKRTINFTVEYPGKLNLLFNGIANDIRGDLSGSPVSVKLSGSLNSSYTYFPEESSISCNSLTLLGTFDVSPGDYSVELEIVSSAYNWASCGFLEFPSLTY